IGYEEGGYLTEAVRRRPYCVVLLDEVEKAHPDVFNILLQVLDDGRLTDSQGRTVDFRNAIIIMTSNLGSDRIQAMSDDEEYEKMKELVLEVVANHFRPEFINRIDDLVVFHGLRQEQVLEIAGLQVHRVVQRLLDQDLTLEIKNPVIEYLGMTGFDPVYGARPLKRAIQNQLETPLANEILSGQYNAGSKIIVDLQGGKLNFSTS
ncbi:MAG: AAA domain-containing protein, partial [Gammaproteobacteria bacterium]|nr:AAA domain-containing protein [Gammaproteobacteria bacterium]